jgi:hypothetical protein
MIWTTGNRSRIPATSSGVAAPAETFRMSAPAATLPGTSASTLVSVAGGGLGMAPGYRERQHTCVAAVRATHGQVFVSGHGCSGTNTFRGSPAMPEGHQTQVFSTVYGPWELLALFFLIQGGGGSAAIRLIRGTNSGFSVRGPAPMPNHAACTRRIENDQPS